MKITFKCDHYDKDDKVELTAELMTTSELLLDVIEDFKHFLLAAGFSPKNINDYFDGEDNE